MSTLPAGQPITYETDNVVAKSAEYKCTCVEKNRPDRNCEKESAEEFKKSVAEMHKSLSKKELTRRSIVTACIPEISKNFASKFEMTTLKNTPAEERAAILKEAAIPTCECFSQINVNSAFVGFENKKDFTKEDQEKIKEALKTFKASSQGKEQTSTCIFEGHLILPLLTIPAYDAMDVFVKECSALTTELIKLLQSIEENLELVQRYSKTFCECAHPKLKGNETKAVIAGLCSNEATNVVGKNLNVDPKKNSHKEIFRNTVQNSCLEKMNGMITKKVESSSLKTLTEETKIKLEALALISYCDCTSKIQAESLYEGIPDKKNLNVDEEKKIKENRKAFEKSYKRAKNEEACLTDAFIMARKQISDEIKAKNK